MIDSGDEGHGLHERFPGVPLPGEDTPPLGRQPVKPPAALARFLDPLPLDPAAFLEPVEQGIEGRDVELELPTGACLDELAVRDRGSGIGARWAGASVAAISLLDSASFEAQSYLHPGSSSAAVLLGRNQEE
jgi:hypothetical protein